MNLLSLAALVALLLLLLQSAAPFRAPAGDRPRLTRVVRVRQGALRGVVRQATRSENLQAVEAFLGVPYAAPPVGSQRLMPPRSPPAWDRGEVRLADRFGRVCPQALPDIAAARGRSMSEARYQYLSRLFRHLQDQSEDCLFLNIYAPAQESGWLRRKYPVIVFIHGESYEWNSGNPYDGSVLASYGLVVVVTINYRLGILGFLRPSVEANTLSNFGLLDQIAALQWVQDNIEEFGGDPRLVTLMGHGTGAACVNLLLVSPVSSRSGHDLFQRAVMMSGSALADWALTTNPIQTTAQVAQALNCPLAESEMAPCLRRKRLSELMAARVEARPFQTLFGPVVDGSVVVNDPEQLMSVYPDQFSKYDLLYGVTELESYHLLGGVALSYGVLERERDQLLHAYFQDKFQFRPDVALAETLKEYTDWRRSQSRPAAEGHRDVLLDVLSDARVAAPLVRAAGFHSGANPRSYFYVFTHRSLFGDFADERQHRSIHGEELPYVFGVPVDGDDSHFHQAYNLSENLFSEAVMTFWTNFAHTGNPNAPKRLSYLTHSKKEWEQYDIDWPEYDVKNQSYITLGIPPKIGHHYRKKTISFWNEVLPKLLESPGGQDNNPTASIPEPGYEAPKQPPDPPSKFKPSTRRQPGPPTGSDFFENFSKPEVKPSNWNGEPSEDDSTRRAEGNNNKIISHPTDESHFPEEGKSNQQEMPQNKDKQSSDSSVMAMGIVIVVGVVFLLVNLSACIALYYQTHRLKAQEDIIRRRYEDADEEEYGTRRRVLALEEAPRPKQEPNEPTEGVYEAVSGKKAQQSEADITAKRWRLSRQCSASTMDPHTKVREWIAHEIVQRCSPRFLRKTRLHHQHQQVSFEDQMPPSISTESHPTATTSKHGAGTSSQRSRAAKKVSVAVDATPSARTPSILKQTPIEVSKSLDQLGAAKCISTSMLTLAKKPSLKRCATAGENLAVASTSSTMAGSSPREIIRRSSSINFKVYTPPLQFQTPETVTIEHHHSRSDPDKQTSSYCSQVDERKMCSAGELAAIHLDSKGHSSSDKFSLSSSQLHTFYPSTTTKHSILKNRRDAEVTASPTSNLPVNINVTSRDSTEDNEIFSSTDRLATIQKRKFPKVLPDFPLDQEDTPHQVRELTPVQAVAAKRRSLPISGNLQLGLPLGESGSVSQPTTPTSGSHKDIQTQTTNGRVPPPPPPRVSSTLGRKPSNNSSPIIPLTIEETVQIREGVQTPSSPASSTASHVSRPEPKVIIKPNTSARKTPGNQNIPRVTPRTNDYPLKPPHPTTPVQEPPARTQVLERKVPQAGSSASVPVPVPKVPAAVSSKKGPAAAKASKKSSGTSTDESGSNTGTVKRGKKPSDGKGGGSSQGGGGKPWYAQYSQSFLSRSKEEG
ncbi:uncharacterized protein LOC134532300 [Bacillus rossius redtenbacheri]|uniref:uncharacterized protein LOC134532300 n=1 Tax=Bacillus rossius redtenbacheri TaxID=93214 RepID=UPI002FDD707A